MSPLHCDNSHIGRTRRGLTLLELVIVLVILAALTGIAVVSLEPIADQSRYDATKQTLENVQDAIATLPPVRRGNGSLAVHGFVSDMGRLPRDLDELSVKPVNEANPSKNIFEFGADVDYGVQRIVAGSSTSEGLPCGWRGPYLQVTSLQTSWGTQFTTQTTIDPIDTSRVVVDEISAEEPGTTNAITFPVGPKTLTDLAYVDVTVTASSSPTAVSLFVPDANADQLKELSPVGSPTNSPYVFSNVPVGVRLVRVTYASSPVEYRYIDVVPGMAPVTF